MSNYKKFCTTCAVCGSTTSKSFARANAGKCKSCVTGVTQDISNHPLLCPDCREHLRTPYQKRNGYHCDACMRQTDPVGYANECRGLYDGPDY